MGTCLRLSFCVADILSGGVSNGMLSDNGSTSVLHWASVWVEVIHLRIFICAKWRFYVNNVVKYNMPGKHLVVFNESSIVS